MNEERLMILQMLAEGKISVEEAEQLLSALEEEPPDGPTDETSHATDYDYDWASFPDFEQFFKQGCQRDLSQLFEEGVKACQTFKGFAEGFPFWSGQKKEWPGG